MKASLKNNLFTATQWFKDGDHPNEEREPGTGEYSITHKQTYVYTKNITPGMWIVEMFDGIHLFTDDAFRELFEEKEGPK